MNSQLEQIAKSYDRHFIERGKKDSLDYDNLPDYITGHPEYPMWKTEMEGETLGSDIILEEYLKPEKGMNFILLGCGVNLMYKGYDKWPSKYYGVDISGETVSCLDRYVDKHNLSIGSLYCGSIHETPFEDSFFDIGECIGVLEYYKKDFIAKIIEEIYRILKPGGRFVLDIPNSASSSGRIAMMVEECMGRPDEFDMSPSEFENMVGSYFIIEDSDMIRAKQKGRSHEGMVCLYCLKCRK